MSTKNTLVLVVEVDDEQEASIMASLPDGVRLKMHHASCDVKDVVVRDEMMDRSYREAYRIVDSLRRFINPYPGEKD